MIHMKKISVGAIKLKTEFTSEMVDELRDLHISNWEDDMERKIIREMKALSRVKKLSQIIDKL